ncbi:hypothetical protein RDWZM_007645 [Blomia tropicalis]|uniref:Uncharacterized protein n=1 Tax=Blomia tropicalis TaxID=40697 RepID=A0A9Q0RI63_BLOTA|nr:hypothetical protein RDWZM_007645 [Blomia tropicalis]
MTYNSNLKRIEIRTTSNEGNQRSKRASSTRLSTTYVSGSNATSATIANRSAASYGGAGSNDPSFSIDVNYGSKIFVRCEKMVDFEIDGGDQMIAKMGKFIKTSANNFTVGMISTTYHSGASTSAAAPFSTTYQSGSQSGSVVAPIWLMVERRSLRGAIERFSSAFINPLLSNSSIEREIEPIDTEFVSTIIDDNVRCKLLLTQIANRQQHH